MSTDYTKRLKLWRLTLSVSLPIWMKSVGAWVFHPIRTYRRKVAAQLRAEELAKQLALEEKWAGIFTDTFGAKKPEFELDPKGRFIGMKETAAEAKIPSVGIWCGGMDHGDVDRALRGSGMRVNFDTADEETVERRRQKMTDEELMQYQDRKGNIQAEDGVETD